MDKRSIWTALCLGVSLCVVMPACGDDDDAQADGGTRDAGAHADAGGGDAGKPCGFSPMAGAKLEIAGDFQSMYGDERIRDDDWSGSAIVEFDNDQNFAVTQNPDDAEYDPGKYNKLVWTEPDAHGFYYCTVDFGLDSQDDAAQSSMTADDSDPDNGGCGGFAWTKLEPVCATPSR